MFPVSRCPICGSGLRPRFQVDAGDRKMRVSCCFRCGSYVKDPFFDEAELSSIYAHYDHHEKHYNPSPGVIENLTCKLERIERFAPRRGRLLEIGCGRGHFLLQALRRGWDAEGIEIEGSARENLLPELSGRTSFIRSELEYARLRPSAYDVICSYQLFEHLVHPVDSFRAWSAALKPGGLMVLDTPNASSLGARLRQARWLHHGRQEHFVLPSRSALERLYRQNGLSILRIQSGGPPALCSGPPSKHFSAARLYRNPTLTRLVRVIIHRLGLGDHLEVIGRKYGSSPIECGCLPG